MKTLAARCAAAILAATAFAFAASAFADVLFSGNVTSASGEKMGGSPLTRATSLDGRWAYTLYDGAGRTPFVHAPSPAAGTANRFPSGLNTVTPLTGAFFASGSISTPNFPAS